MAGGNNGCPMIFRNSSLSSLSHQEARAFIPMKVLPFPALSLPFPFALKKKEKWRGEEGDD